ncbi:MAG: acyl-CoA dehydrogenase, partial [Actinomycetota bacterium]|nr:acyl-CoA dehydrogenase [Actinomycetota bacterium]
ATVARQSVVRNGDGTVSGRPEPVIYGASADLLVLPADDELVVVDLTGIDRSSEPAMDQTRQLAWLDLERAPATTVGDVYAVAAHLDRGAVFHSAELLGAANAVMDLAVDYAGQREQFGQPIGSFQAVKHRCADMLVDVEGMRSTVYHAAWLIGAEEAEGDDATVAAAVAKIWCSDAGLRVAESALQVHGGIGFTWESDVHLYLKRIQLDQVSFGDAEHHRIRLGELLRRRVADGTPIL